MKGNIQEEMTRCSIAYRVIDEIIRTQGDYFESKIAPGSVNAFNTVKNYLANILAQHCSF